MKNLQLASEISAKTDSIPHWEIFCVMMVLEVNKITRHGL